MFHATVNGEHVSIGCFMFHFQEDPYPGGLTYEIVVEDAELVDELAEYYHSKSVEKLGWQETQSVFRAVSMTVSLKLPNEKLTNPIRYWANTIEKIAFGQGKVIVSGICSPHIDTDQATGSVRRP